MRLLKFLIVALFYLTSLYSAELPAKYPIGKICVEPQSFVLYELDFLINKIEDLDLKTNSLDFFRNKKYESWFNYLKSGLLKDINNKDKSKINIIIGCLLLDNLVVSDENYSDYFVQAIVEDSTPLSYAYIRAKMESKPQEIQFRLKYVFYNKIFKVLDYDNSGYAYIINDAYLNLINKNMYMEASKYLAANLEFFMDKKIHDLKFQTTLLNVISFEIINILITRNFLYIDLVFLYEFAASLSYLFEEFSLQDVLYLHKCVEAFGKNLIGMHEFCLNLKNIKGAFLSSKKFSYIGEVLSKISKDNKELDLELNKLLGSLRKEKINLIEIDKILSKFFDICEYFYFYKIKNSQDIINYLNIIYETSESNEIKLRVMYLFGCIYEDQAIEQMRKDNSGNSADGVILTIGFNKLKVKAMMHYQSVIDLSSNISNEVLKNRVYLSRLKIARLMMLSVTERPNLDLNERRLLIDKINIAISHLLKLHASNNFGIGPLKKISLYLMDACIKSLIRHQMDSDNPEILVLFYEVYQYMYGLNGIRDLDLAYNLLMEIENKYNCKIAFDQEIVDLKSEVNDRLVKEAEEKSRAIQAQEELLRTDIRSKSSKKKSCQKKSKKQPIASSSNSNSLVSDNQNVTSHSILGGIDKISYVHQRSIDYDDIILKSNKIAKDTDGSYIILDRKNKKFIIFDSLRKCKYFFNYTNLALNDYGVFEPYKFSYDKRVNVWFTENLADLEPLKIDSHRFCIAVDFVIQFFGKYVLYDSEHSHQKQNSLIMEVFVEEDSGLKYKACFEYTFYVNKYHKEILYHRLLRKLNK